MLEAISKMFDSTFPASFINFSFLPKYASYFVDGVLNTLALSIVAVLLAVIPALLLALMRLEQEPFHPRAVRRLYRGLPFHSFDGPIGHYLFRRLLHHSSSPGLHWLYPS